MGQQVKFGGKIKSKDVVIAKARLSKTSISFLIIVAKFKPEAKRANHGQVDSRVKGLLEDWYSSM